MAKLPTNGYRHLVAISDEDGNAAAIIFDGSVYRLAVDATLGGPIVIGAVTISDVVPGLVITTPAQTAVPAGPAVPLPVAPAGSRRMRVQVTGGDATTLVLIRELAGAAGEGVALTDKGSTMYGGADGALAALEAEFVTGSGAEVVRVQFEG